MRDKRPRAHWATQRSRLDRFVTALNEALHGDRAAPVIAFMCQCEQPTNWLFGNKTGRSRLHIGLPPDCARR